ncbi:hypothetical protein GEMRC1_004527 [Eukaryota sp. GEM-RC1]
MDETDSNPPPDIVEPKSPVQNSPPKRAPSSFSTPKYTPSESDAVNSAHRSIARQRMAEFSKHTDELRLGITDSDEHEKKIAHLRKLRQDEKERRRKRFAELKERRQYVLKQEEEEEQKRKQEEDQKKAEYLEHLKQRQEILEKKRQDRKQQMKQAKQNYKDFKKKIHDNPPFA